MENGRAPGIGGLPVEFYKTFWAVIGQDVLEVLRDSMNVGQLPLCCRRAVLTLLPKKGDLTHLNNWHPVSLLCTDIKLLSKALASRPTKAMDQITHQDQLYCVPDSQLLHRWRTARTSEERIQLMDYQITETNPAEEGPFPQLDIAPDLDGSEGPLLECWAVREMDF
ncbi:hypothetical protein QTP70_030999, partial [Hemibagrus guttatus]